MWISYRVGKNYFNVSINVLLIEILLLEVYHKFIISTLLRKLTQNQCTIFLLIVNRIEDSLKRKFLSKILYKSGVMPNNNRKRRTYFEEKILFIQVY